MVMAASSTEYLASSLTPTLTKGLVALCEAKPADPVTWLARWLQANRPAPLVKPVPVSATVLELPPEDTIPGRVRALFSRLDTDPDHILSKDELVKGLGAEFPQMRESTRMLVPALWDAHAIPAAGGGARGLDLELFNSAYAAILYSHFDANGDGLLQLDEAMAALRFLRPYGEDVAETFAFPPEAYTPNGVQLSPEWFYGIYQAMG